MKFGGDFPFRSVRYNLPSPYKFHWSLSGFLKKKSLDGVCGGKLPKVKLNILRLFEPVTCLDLFIFVIAVRIFWSKMQCRPK
jgi:hypothetical protein